MHRKRILIFVDWYLPGYKGGGPIQSVANMVGHLKDEFDFRIITTDRDLHATEPYEGIKVNEWIERPDGSKVYYFSPDQLTFGNLKKLMLAEQADVLYMNSLFSVFFTLYPLWIRKKYLPSRKTVLAPRGMLGAGALNIKPLKKKVFLLLEKFIGLYRNVRWQASSELEADEIRKQFGSKCQVQVAMNLTAPRILTNTTRLKTPGSLKAVFISRISYKKNLQGTLELLAKLPTGIAVEFDVFGPIEDQEYWGSCESLIQSMPSHIKVNYKGSIPNDQVVSLLKEYHLSILLTFNENFGHSIIESLAAGCPVLISDQTPWKHLQVEKAGWVYPLNDQQRIMDTILFVAGMDQHSFDEWSNGAINKANEVIHNEEALNQNRTLFA